MAVSFLSRPGSLFAFLWFIIIPLLLPARDSAALPADTSTFIVIGKITLEGNRHTRASIILRELKFRENDTLAGGALPGLLRTSRENVFNTRLFNIVSLDSAIVPGTNRVDVAVHVIERWYIWPIPYFEFADRNFNVWWETRDLSRLTFGVDLTFFNMRGRNETLTLLMHLGYDQLYGFTYKTPYINRKQTIGIGFGAGVELNHEVAAATYDNKPVYVKDPSEYLRQLVFGFAELFYRPGYYTLHTFRFDYQQYYFDDKVAHVDGFTLYNSNVQQLFFLS